MQPERREDVMMLLSVLICLFLLLPTRAVCWRPWRNDLSNSSIATGLAYGSSKRYEGSSNLVELKYHMGPIFTHNVSLYIIWYGQWEGKSKRIIRSFLNSISAEDVKKPSVAGWWSTVRLYYDQTGKNVTGFVNLVAEKNDRFYSSGKYLERLSIQKIIATALKSSTVPLPVNSKGGLYLVLTSPDVVVKDFCSTICGFHAFTFPSIVGYTLPYAWVGNSEKQCPGTCAYPFAMPEFIPAKPAKAPNGNPAVDGMISVIAHEIAETATNTFANGWYAGEEASFPNEIADLCEGIYGTGGGGSYTGQMLNGGDGATYNMNGIRRRFLVQWLWNHILKYCHGPNALDG